MKTHDARLVPATAAGMAACHLVATGTLPWRPVALAAIVISVVAVTGVKRLSTRRGVLADVAIAIAVVGAVIGVLVGATGYRLDSRVATGVREAIEVGAHMEIHGEVIAEARSAASDTFTGHSQWQATVLASDVGGSPAHARIRIVVDDPAGLDLGVRVHVAGRASESRDARDAAVVWDARVLSSGPPDRISSLVSSAREGLRNAAAGLPHEVRALTEGMVIGDDSRMAPEQVESMRRSGLAHLTAVSGAHFAVLTLAVVWLVRRAKAPRIAQGAAVAVGAGAFTVLVGAEPSVSRAITMAMAIALALAWGRPARAVPALCSGVLVLLALDPFLATSLGFQLSVVAVAAIAVWAPHLAHRFAKRMTAGLARVLAIPVTAAAATSPLLVGVAGGIGVYSVPANLIAAPFAGPVTVLGLVGTALAPLSPHGAQALVTAAGAAAWPVSVAAREFSTAPGAWLEWPAGAWAGPAAAALVVLGIVASMSVRVRGWSAAGIGGLILVLLVAPTVLDATRTPRLPDWDVVVCDVGQGDMMLLRTAAHSAVVIDTGPRDGGAIECLARHGVREVDLLLITHPHADHDGAVAQLVRTVPIHRAWVSPAGIDAGSVRVLTDAGVTVDAVAAPRFESIGAVQLRVVAPTRGSDLSNDNDASVVVLADAGGVQLLALGDLEAAGQAAIARSLVTPVVVDLVKVAHHGSADQDSALAGMITARVAAVSVGADNSYGHPAASTVALYAARVGTLHRTDECGDLLLAAGPTFRIASRCPS